MQCVHLSQAVQCARLKADWCCNTGIIVPPLPEKSAVQKFQMTADFIEQRRRALQVFINRVVSQAACTV